MALRAILVFLLFAVVTASVFAAKGRVAIFLPDNFRWAEYEAVRRALTKAGYYVTIYSYERFLVPADEGKPTIMANYALLDMLVDDIDKYVALVTIGGPGAVMILQNERKYKEVSGVLVKAAEKAFSSKKVVAAICASPYLLLDFFKAHNIGFVAWPFDPMIAKAGDLYKGYEGVLVDEENRVITAPGPKFAKEFAKRLVKLLEKAGK